MRCALAQIRIIKVHEVLAQITRDNFFLWKDKDKNLVYVGTNHKKNRFQHVLAQITRDNFFLWKDNDKKEVCVGTNQNKQIQKYASTNHKWYWLVITCQKD